MATKKKVSKPRKKKKESKQSLLFNFEGIVYSIIALVVVVLFIIYLNNAKPNNVTQTVSHPSQVEVVPTQ